MQRATITDDDDDFVYMQTDALFAIPFTAIAGLCAVVTMAAFFWEPQHKLAMTLWLVATVLHAATWLGLTWRWRQIGRPDNARKWRTISVAIMAACGSSWGFGALYTVPNGTADQALLVTVVVMGSIAMMFPYTIYNPAFLAYQIPVILLGGIGFAISGNSLGWVIGLLSLLMCAAMAELGRQMGDRMIRGFRLAIENASLVTTLKEQAKEIERSNLDLRRLSLSDPLTGLANRRRLVDALRSEGRTPGAALIHIDVDHFKQYNDAYGHGAGDDCLIQVGNALASHAEVFGGLAARQGGEEFSILIGAAGGVRADIIAEALRKKIEGLKENGAPLARQVTISVGFAYRRPGMNDDQFMHAADEATYRAKRSGRNRVCGPADAENGHIAVKAAS